MTNPILEHYRNSYTRPINPVDAFDEANGKAWTLAGCPDDRPGSEWAAWEEEASRVIESEYVGKLTGWEIVDDILSEWENFDGDVSWFYDKWARIIETRGN